ncbi:MAG: polysaccharide biosynthesis protein [Promethearchaeota archaeon]|nr:MAG: polysaccharide biosynthesis protein [Candidatus Lokiarchaeota archaeon]
MGNQPEQKKLQLDFEKERKFFEHEGSSRVITSGSLYMFFSLINASCIWIFIILGTDTDLLIYFGLTTALNGIISLIGIGISRYFIAEIKAAFVINEELGRLKATSYSKLLFLIGVGIGLVMIATPFVFGFFITNKLLRECIFASGFSSFLIYGTFVFQIGLEIKNRYDIIAFTSIFNGIFILLFASIFIIYKLDPFGFAFYPFFNIITLILLIYFFKKLAPYSIREIFRAKLRSRNMRKLASPEIRDFIENHQILIYMKNSLYSMMINIQNSKFFEDILYFIAAIYLAIFDASFQNFGLSLLTVLMAYGAVKSVILYYSAPLNIEIAEACAKDRHETVEESVNASTRISSILALGFLTAMVALSKELLFFLHRDLFIEGTEFNWDLFFMGQTLFIIIITGQFLYGYSTLFGNALIGSGNAGLAAKGFTITLLIILATSPIFIYINGILGIGIVMLISSLFLLPYILIQLKRKLDINYNYNFFYRLIPNLILLFFIMWIFPYNSTLSILIGIILGATLYLFLNPFFGVSIPEDLQMINDLFNTLKLKLAGNLIVNAMKITYNFSPLNKDRIIIEENKLVLVKK